jgi:rfaE bifunctional protein kinase chain/domain
MAKGNLEKVFKNFESINCLVIGDVMLDTYWWGESERMSPEAPVAVVDIQNTDHRLGGAANVALNTQALGANTILCSVVGNDENGKLIKQLLEKQQLSTDFILESTSRKTTQKNRVMSRHKQMIRFDVESKHELSDEEFDALTKKVSAVVEHGSMNVIVLQDYNKGLLSARFISFVLQLANEKNIPVAVDPKSHNFFEYKNVALFKPNLKEIREALNTYIDKHSTDSILNASKLLMQQLHCNKILITLSEKGIFGYSEEEHFLFPAYERNIADVSGAGDTVIAVAALCISQQLDFELTARLSNIAGGLVCEEVGVTPINKEKFLQQAAMHIA